jgi:predicted ferric reductase
MTRVLRAFVILCAVILYPAAYVMLFFAGNWYSFFHAYSLAMFFGLLSYAYVTVALCLSARIKCIDRLFGYDRVMAFHAALSSIAILSGMLHAVLKSAYFPDETTQSSLGVAALGLFVLVATATFTLMLETPLDRVPPFSWFLPILKRRVRIDYTRLKLFHNLTGPAFALLVAHVLLAYPVQESPVRMYLAAASGGIAIVLYASHKIVRPLLLFRNPHAVTSIETLTDGIVTITMRPMRGKPFPHKAGQFSFFMFLSRKTGFGEHPFTISSPPSQDAASITIKSLGDFTSRLPGMRIGTACLIDGPYGLFHPQGLAEPMLFVAGGIGITPILSILRDLEWRSCPPSFLIWSVRRKAEAFAKDELERISERIKGFAFRVIVTGEPSFGKDSPDGRIDRELLTEALNRVDPARRGTVYVCGPDALRRAVEGHVVSLGIPKQRVIYEAFSL